jgi:uncharacterized protein YacL
MNRGAKLLVQIAGAILGTAALVTLGDLVVFYTNIWPLQIARPVSGIVGFVIGALLLPRIVSSALGGLRGLSVDALGTTIAGILIGLLASALLAYPLSFLSSPLRIVAPIVSTICVTYVVMTVLHDRPHDFVEWVKSVRPTPAATLPMTGVIDNNTPTRKSILLDTSVIIDGRITDISKTGFLTASLLVPNFVLNELQYIADSGDALRRKRGRRGLEVLNVLQAECPIPLEITDIDVSEVREVDSKLVALARHLSVPIMTNDYNLNRVAGLQGVTVLNLNDLANAVKAAYLPGEELTVKVIQEGREHGQGVGYLEDGTMVVIEEGRYHLNRMLEVIVTKVLQTSAGRMIFAKIVD